MSIGGVTRTGVCMAGVAVFAATAIATTAFAEPVSVRVVDQNGVPVRDCEIGTNWMWLNGGAATFDEFEFDEAKGVFTGDIDFYNRDQPMVAYSTDRRQAGFAVVSPDDAQNVTITLEPSIHVTGKITCSQLGQDMGDVTVYWMTTGPRFRPIMSQVRNNKLDVRLPRMESWNYWFYGRNVKSISKVVEFDEGTSTLELGTIDMEATFIALNVGRKVEDWNVTDARGLPMDKVQISDHKGKWVLAEFWGFW